MKSNVYARGLGLAVGVCVFASILLQAASLTDYGAFPTLPKPPEDQLAANEKLDFHTDLFTGRFGYTVPIAVPPGRGGSEPSIALQYNSSGQNTWCGVGWDLDLGYIQRETRYGVPISGGSYVDSKGFIYSVAGQSGRLILASDGTYRPEINTAFLKFTYSSGYWVVTDQSGRTYTFGQTSASQIDTSYGTFKWALNSIADPNGNQTTITYQTAGSDGQLYLDQISYNANGNSPTIAANCTVNFALQSTARLDEPSSCLSGQEVYTSRLLNNITVNCNGSQVRSYYLGYTKSSSSSRSLLTSVTEYGTDNTTSFPPLTFGYTVQAQNFSAPIPWGVIPQNLSTVSSYGTGLGTPYVQIIDIDGDGLPDWVIQTNNPPYNNFNVQLNTGSRFSSTVKSWFTVTNEGADLSTTWNAINGSSGGAVVSELMDINGDLIPDRVMRAYTNNGSGVYDHFQVQTNTGSGFGGVVQKWTGVTSDNPNWSGSVLNDTTVLDPPSSVYSLAVMADMNGDGLPDRVMTGGSDGTFDVQLNQRGSFSSIQQWDNVSPGLISGNDAYSPRARDINHVYAELKDMNGDGLPDRLTYNGVQLNNGAGKLSSVQSWYSGDPEVVDVSSKGAYTQQMIDINGDGLPDKVLYYSSGEFQVYFNTGRGFDSNPVYFTGVYTGSGDGTLGWNALSAWDGYGTKVLFIDMNGDGLPDRVMRNYVSGGTNEIMVQLNEGPFPDLMDAATNGIGGTVAITYAPSTEYNNTDGNGHPRLPMPMYTVSSVNSQDGIRAGNITTYGYQGGLYDTTWREFRGFGQVSETNSYGMVTITSFHQGGGKTSIYGEYEDSRFKAGMPYDILYIGYNGATYSETINQVNQVEVDANGVYFPYVAQTISIDSGGTSGYRATLNQYTYNVTANNLSASTGTLLQEGHLGEVTNVDYSYDYTLVPGSPQAYTTYTYAKLPSNANVVDLPASVTISADSAGSTILRQTTNAYFDVTGNLKQRSDLICPGTYANTTYTYDSYGNPLTITDPVTNLTTISYDSTATFPTRKYLGTLGNNLIEYSQYDPRSGSLLAATNMQGLVTANSYDVFLRLINSATSTTQNGPPSLTRTAYQYNLGGISSGEYSYNYVLRLDNDPANSTGYHQTYTYLDGYGRPIQIQETSEISGQYRLSDIFYDSNGNVQAQTYPIFSSSGSAFVLASGTRTNVYTTYDPIARVSAVYPCASANFYYGALNTDTTLSGDSGTSPIGPVSYSYYDGNNPWAVVVTDPLSYVHRYDIDALGHTNQIVEVTSAGNYTTKLSWDPVGDLLSTTDNANNQTSYAYDDMGRRVAVEDPDMGTWQYSYDLAGRLAVQTDAAGQQTKLFYNDPAGRLTLREAFSSSGQPLSTNSFSYDSNGGDSSYTVYPGQLFETIDDQGWQKSSFDVRGRTAKAVRYLAMNGNTYTNLFGYDDADRLVSGVYPNAGPTITNIFDTGGNLSKVQQLGGSNTVFYTATGFDPFDRLKGISFGNGVSSSNIFYSISQRLKQITTAKSTNIQSLVYTYDLDGNIKSVTDGVYSGPGSGTLGNILYDNLNRLTSLTNASGKFSYGYDSIGNVKTNGETGTGAYVYSTVRPHMVTSANGTNYAYDFNGNMVVRGSQRLGFDVNNHLQFVVSTNAWSMFGYDADGARLWKQTSGTNGPQVWIGDNYEEKNGQVLYHIYAANRLVCTFDKTTTNVFEYDHPDNLGSTAIQSDKNGNQIENYGYSAFGRSRYTQSTAIFQVTKLFTSQSFDQDTGLYYYGDADGRYYDPVLARFISPDDIIPDLSNPQSYNHYAYCVNNPLRFTDPTGHWDWPSWSYTWIPNSWVSYLGGGASEPTVRQPSDSSSWMAMQQAELGGYDATGLHEVAGAAKTAVSLTPVGTFNTAYTAATGNDAYNPDVTVSRGDQLEAGGQTMAAMLPIFGKLGSVAKDAVKLEQAFKWENKVYYSFRTSEGSIGVGAEAVENGKQLLLKDIAIYPEGQSKLQVGASQITQIRDILADEAKSRGFNELRITGERFSGANPGKKVDITIKLDQ